MTVRHSSTTTMKRRHGSPAAPASWLVEIVGPYETAAFSASLRYLPLIFSHSARPTKGDDAAAQLGDGKSRARGSDRMHRIIVAGDQKPGLDPQKNFFFPPPPPPLRSEALRAVWLLQRKALAGGITYELALASGAGEIAVRRDSPCAFAPFLRGGQRVRRKTSAADPSRRRVVIAALLSGRAASSSRAGMRHASIDAIRSTASVKLDALRIASGRDDARPCLVRRKSLGKSSVVDGELRRFLLLAGTATSPFALLGPPASISLLCPRLPQPSRARSSSRNWGVNLMG